MNHTPIVTTLNTGAQMPLLGLGVYNMYGEAAVTAITFALQIGYRLIDTASMYKNEAEVGKAVRGCGIPRADVFVTTKLNNINHGYDNTLKAFDHSLQLLNVNYIDLYLMHWPIKNQRKNTWRAMEYLLETKQVKAIGVANYLLPFLQEMEGYGNIAPAVNQIEFSPFLNNKETHQYCINAGIQLQAYTPLTKGKMFTNPTIQRLCNTYNKTPAQIILRWNLQLCVSAIPKSANPTRQRENFDVFGFEITESDMTEINNLNQDFRVVENPMDMW